MRLALLLLIGLAACGPGTRGTVAPGSDPATGVEAGHLLMEAGEYELARKAYLRAVGTEGLDADILSGLGAVSLQLGRLGQAEALLRAATERDPGFVPALNNLGVVLMERGETAEAARLFRAARDADGGDNADIRANLDLALSKLDSPGYAHTQSESFALIRRGNGDWRLLSRKG